MTQPPRPARTARRFSRRSKVIAIVAAVVLLLAVIVVVLDVGLRAYAEGQVRQKIDESLPANVAGDVAVSIGGGSFLLQYVAGSFDEVTLTSDDLSVDGVPVAATVVANGVPTDSAKPVAHVSATLDLSQQAVNSFVSIPGSDEVVLGDGTVGYSGSFDIFGLELGYDVTASAAPSGPDVLLTPNGANLRAGSANVDVSGALKAVVAKPVPICVAKYIPQGVQLTAITPTAGHVQVTAEAANLLLTPDALRTTGACN